MLEYGWEIYVYSVETFVNYPTYNHHYTKYWNLLVPFEPLKS